MTLFRPVDHEEHQDEVAICVGFLGTDEYPAVLQMFDRCYDAAEVLLEAEEPMAFYLVRHCAELGLKLAAGNWPEEHNLGSLLSAVSADHKVRGPGEDARRFRSLLQDVVRADASGQAGRYPFLTSGLPAFEGVCHVPRDDLALFLSDTWFLLRKPFDTPV